MHFIYQRSEVITPVLVLNSDSVNFIFFRRYYSALAICDDLGGFELSAYNKLDDCFSDRPISTALYMSVDRFSVSTRSV